MSYTMKTINDRFKAFGLEWSPKAFGLTGYKPTQNGFVVKPGFMGMTRPYWNDMLFGSSTFCFVFCPVIAKHAPADAVFGTFPDTELWVFEIPADIHAAAVQQIGTRAGIWLCRSARPIRSRRTTTTRFCCTARKTP